MIGRRRPNGAGAPVVLLALTVIGRPGTDGELRVQSMYSHERTVVLLREAVDRFEATKPPTGEDTTE